MTTEDTDALARFAALVEAYGAEPSRWPADRRAWAEQFLARSDAARAIAAEAAALDAALDRAPLAPPPAALIGRVLAAAPRAGARARSASWWLGGFWRPAAGLAAAAVLGIGLGAFGPAFPSLAGADQETVSLDTGLSLESEL
jgi:hypothetical protein